MTTGAAPSRTSSGVQEPAHRRAGTPSSAEHVGREACALDANGLGPADQSGLQAAVAAERLERLLPRLEIDEVADGDVPLGEAGVRCRDA